MSRLVLLTSLAASVLALPPELAGAGTVPTEIINCSVEFAGGSQEVAITVGSVRDPALVEHSAAICTDLIQSGDWVGADSNVDWLTVGYRVVCIVAFSPYEGADVFGRPNPDARQIAGQACSEFEADYPVTYYP